VEVAVKDEWGNYVNGGGDSVKIEVEGEDDDGRVWEGGGRFYEILFKYMKVW
jgi:hypothetical protein